MKQRGRKPYVGEVENGNVKSVLNRNETLSSGKSTKSNDRLLREREGGRAQSEKDGRVTES